MKILYDVLIKKLYIFAVLFGLISYLATFITYDIIGFLLSVACIILVVAYWISMPIAFKAKATIHSLGHFLAFEFAFFFPIRNVQFEGMAGMGLYIIFAFFVLVVLIGMIVLAIAGSVRKNAESQNNKSAIEEN